MMFAYDTSFNISIESIPVSSGFIQIKSVRQTEAVRMGFKQEITEMIKRDIENGMSTEDALINNGAKKLLGSNSIYYIGSGFLFLLWEAT
jgi:hypothetical protein